ncbi:hypothetical protein DFJ73DRAFT_61095 [Zopfochytrium polystomum]|nr:hypothetical protein DFJ73DRAFT_61095 [Zopfochytrium polystomum]
MEGMSGTDCELAPAAAVKRLRDPEHLCCGRSRFGDASARAIADYVAKCAASDPGQPNDLTAPIVVINFPFNNFSSRGARRIADAVRMNATLERLTISVAMMGQPGLQALCTAVGSHRSVRAVSLLGLRGSRHSLEPVAEAIERSQVIERLELACEGRLTGFDELCTKLEGNATIRSFSLDWDIFNPELAEALARVLQSSTSMIASLALVILRNDLTATNVLAEGLLRNSSLQSLILRHKGDPLQDGGALRPSLTRLLEAFIGNAVIKSLQFTSYGPQRKATPFSGNECLIGSAVEQLLNHPDSRLAILHLDVPLSDMDARAITRGLINNTSLNELKLHHSNFPKSAVPEFASAVARHPALQTLAVPESGLDCSAVAAVIGAVAEAGARSALRELDIRPKYFMVDEETEQDFTAMVRTVVGHFERLRLTHLQFMPTSTRDTNGVVDALPYFYPQIEGHEVAAIYQAIAAAGYWLESADILDWFPPDDSSRRLFDPASLLQLKASDSKKSSEDGRLDSIGEIASKQLEQVTSQHWTPPQRWTLSWRVGEKWIISPQAQRSALCRELFTRRNRAARGLLAAGRFVAWLVAAERISWMVAWIVMEVLSEDEIAGGRGLGARNEAAAANAWVPRLFTKEEVATMVHACSH